MLKTRVIPTLLMRDVGLVKGVAFDSWRRVGTPLQAINVFNVRGVDELILLDIGATPEGREPDYDLVSTLAEECFVPLTVGGGVRSIEAVRRLLRAGADKVSLNSAAFRMPELVSEAALRFGSQCVVVSIDYRRGAGGRPQCFIDCGQTPTDLDPVRWARRAEELGAGELLLTSIERDGTMEGFDVETISEVSASIRIPLIAAGGAGSYEHLRLAITEGGASAVSAASMYLFTEATPAEAKVYLAGHGVLVRDGRAGPV